MLIGRLVWEITQQTQLPGLSLFYSHRLQDKEESISPPQTMTLKATALCIIHTEYAEPDRNGESSSKTTEEHGSDMIMSF